MTVLFAQSRVSDTSLTEIISLMNEYIRIILLFTNRKAALLYSKIALFKNPIIHSDFCKEW